MLQGAADAVTTSGDWVFEAGSCDEAFTAC